MASGSPIPNSPLLASIYKKHTARGFLVQPLVEAYRPRMVDDPDIWRAANLLVKRHSDDAASVAAMRADELLNHGDVEGYESGGAFSARPLISCAPRRPRASGSTDRAPRRPCG